MRPGEFKILAALMNEPSGLIYTEIRRITKLSNPVLSEYLTGLAKEGIVLKSPKDEHKLDHNLISPKNKHKFKHSRSLYYLARAYQRRQNLENFERVVARSMQNIPWEGARIAQVRDRDLRKRIYEDFFSFYRTNVSILIVMAIRRSVIQVFKEKMKKTKEQDFWKELQRLKKKEIKRFAEQTARRWEEEVTQYHSLLQEKLVNLVIPYIQMLALAYMANAEFTLPGIGKELPERFTKEAVRNTFWFKQLEIIDQELARRDPEFARLLKESTELEKEIENEESGGESLGSRQMG